MQLKRFIPFVLIVALFGAGTFAASVSCTPIQTGVTNAGTVAKNIAFDCGTQVVRDAIPNVLPEVNKILISSNMTEAAKDSALDQLKIATDALRACVLRQALEDLSNRFMRGTADVAPARMAARTYIERRGYLYADGFTVQRAEPDGGAGGAAGAQ
jgi:hypothetical protein